MDLNRLVLMVAGIALAAAGAVLLAAIGVSVPYCACLPL
jgi:hypothetical protein